MLATLLCYDHVAAAEERGHRLEELPGEPGRLLVGSLALSTADQATRVVLLDFQSHRLFRITEALALGDFGRLAAFAEGRSYLARVPGAAVERGMDLLDHISGGRLLYHYIRIGGVKRDVSQDWLDELDARDHFFHHFDHVFNSYHMGRGKRDPGLFPEIAAKLSLQPGEILFVDDLQTNIERAQAAGWQTILYVDKTGFLESIDEMLGADHP